MKKIPLTLLSLIIALSLFAQGEKRIALVIGNNAYINAPLKNPVNDANLMATTLQGLGFTVIKKVNANRVQMGQAIAEFWSKLGNYNVALFFYAGHGVQVNGINYLIPVDATLESQDMVSFEAISVNDVVQKFEEYPKNTNIVILDACRNNPFRSWARGGERGFVAMKPGSGTLIAFATSEGSTAADGAGTNGLYTEKLVKNLKKPVPIETVFKNTRVDVQNASGGSQSPQEWTKLTGDFYFSKPSGEVANNNVPTNNTSTEISISEEALPPGSIKLTSYVAGTLYIDGQSKGAIASGKVYNLNNIPAGSHKLKIGEWVQDVDVASNQTAQVSAKSNKTNEMPNQLLDNRDNKTYKTVKIGNQVWMAENLAFKSDSNCWAYNNSSDKIAKYGYLYNWSAAKYACPIGWRLPTKYDFEILLNMVGASENAAYRALRPEGSSGFSALFGGSFQTFFNSFFSAGSSGFFWSNSPVNEELSWALFVSGNQSKSYIHDYKASFGFSVRCLKDN